MDKRPHQSRNIRAETPKWIPWAVAFSATLGFSIPLFFMLAAHGYYLPFSAESLVYRYFGSVRILAGEGGTVFLPQGLLITALQNCIVAVLHAVDGNDLESTLELFSLLCSLTVSAAMFGIYLAACSDKSLSILDRSMVLVVGPATVLGTVHAGFYYTLLPDYLALNLPIITGAVYLAIRSLRTQTNCRIADVLGVGALCGIAASNKLTLLGPMGIVALLVITRHPITFNRFLLRTAAAALACATGYLLVFAAAFRFKYADVVQELRYSVLFLNNAGAEPNFWASNFRMFMRGYGYDNVVSIWIAATLFLGVEIILLKKPRMVLLLAGNILVAGLLSLGLWKRGAGTTFFEASSILAGLAALVLAVGLGLRARGRWVFAIPAAIALGAAFKFDYRHNWFVVSKGRELGQTVWQARRYAVNFHQPIVVIIPDRSYFTGSVEELLQTAFFLSGYGPASPELKDRFLDRTSFRSEVGVIETGTTVVWLEKWDASANRPLKETNRSEGARWEALTKLASLNPGQRWRAGYSDLGLINVMSVVRLK